MSNDKLNQFDFWVGEWDLTWGEDGKGVNRIEKALDGKVIVENFDGTPSTPLVGMSVTTYSKERDCWAQTWVDNQGSYLDFLGGWEDERMILSREGIVEGETVQQRMVWSDIEAGSLEWKWERSEDDGETWQTLWHIHYTRKS